MEFILIILASILFTIPHYIPNLFFLSWLAFIPLIYLIRDNDYSHSFVIALLVGILNSLFSLYWLYRPLQAILRMPFSFNIFILFIYYFLSAIPLAAWVIVNKFLQPQNSYSPFIAALSWTVLEYFRFTYFNFNPLNYFAYTQSAFNLFTQYAAYGGLFLVSFISVLIASYILKIFLEPGWKKSIPPVIILIILIVIPVFLGTFTLADSSQQSVEIMVPGVEFGNNNFQKIEGEIENLSALFAVSEQPFVFTPEKTLSFDLIRNNYYRDQLFSLLEGKLESSYLQLGAQSAADRNYDSEVFNSLFLLSEELEIQNRSNQQQNILNSINFPYFPDLFLFLAENLNFKTDFLNNASTLNIVQLEEFNYLNLFADEIFIPLILSNENQNNNFELIVNSAAEGEINSEVYNNLTFAAAIFRAAETKTALIRSVSNGYSGYINQRGKVIVKKNLENDIQKLDLKLQQSESYYQQNPTKIINIIIIAFLVIAAVKILILLKNKLSSRN